jgi:hypothetical protein
MLSSLPKLADKNFLIGFIMPVLLGATGLLALLRDLPPFDGIYRSLLSTDDFTKLTIVVLTLWAVAILLLLLNLLLYRVLEGYIGPFNRGGWRNTMQDRYIAQRNELAATRAIVTRRDIIVSDALKRDYDRGVLKFGQTWPMRRSMVLPTRFGNVIRAVESYPQALYGIEGVSGWLRLQAVISKDFQGLVDDARAQADFFVNIWLFSCLFALTATARCVLRTWTGSPDWHWILIHAWGYALAAAAGIVAAWLAYGRAIDRASAWGDLVKSAFDLYLPALAQQMGYSLPDTAAQRQRFWGAVSSEFLYQIRMTPELWPRAKSDNAAARDATVPRMADDTPDDNDGDGDDRDDAPRAGARFV